MRETVKKIADVSVKVVVGLIVAFTVFIMLFTIVSVSTVDRHDRSLFGVKFYIVQTDSMSKSDKNADLEVHFNAGDMILIKNVEDTAALKEGDVIAFISSNSDSYGETVTHRIREVKKEDGEVLGYVTYGTNTGVDDEALVEPEFVLGVYAGKLPKVGTFFAFVKSVPGYIVCILVPFVLLILYNGLNVIRLFRQYKKEQSALMDAERAEIAAERKQTEEMLKELQALKAQLLNQGASFSSPPEEKSEGPPEEQPEETTGEALKAQGQPEE
ncbi:MAG: signal peptidase I [Clostridia bacterium]|nr:signal peptidase I [Clostridia bacterium]